MKGEKRIVECDKESYVKIKKRKYYIAKNE
jgi:hypothetical protein